MGELENELTATLVRRQAEIRAELNRRGLTDAQIEVAIDILAAPDSPRT